MKKNSKNTKNKSKKEYKDIPLRAEGRPTKYRKYFANWMLDYFNVDPYEVNIYKNDKGDTKVHLEAVRLPTLERFATKLNVDTDCLANWANAKDPKDPTGKTLLHPEFFGAYQKCKHIQKEILVVNGLKGLYQSNFAIFVATNFTDMMDKKQLDQNLNTEGQVVGFTYIVPKGAEDDSTTGDTASLTANDQTTPSQINP